MKYLSYILYAIILCFSSSSFGQDFDKALKYYDDGQFDKAISEFELLLENDSTDVSVLYNLGLSYHRSKNFIQAKWAFEKAHLIEPGNDQLTEQLNHEHNELDASNSWSSPFTPFEILLLGIGEFYWSLFSIISAILLSLLLFLMSRRKSQRTIYGITSFFLLCILGVCMYFAYTSKSIGERQYAIVKTDLASNKTLIRGQRVQIMSFTKNNNGVSILAHGKEMTVKSEDLILL